MKKVVISYNRTNLSKFLKDDKEDYSYVSIGLYAPDIEGFLEGKKYKRACVNDGLGAIDFKEEYVNFIGRLNRDYDSLYWRATTVSYKGTFASNTCKDIFNYYCAVSLIQKSKCSYIIISDNPAFNNCIKRYCKQNQIDCRLLDGKKRPRGMVHLRRCLLSHAYFLCDGWMRKILISIHLSKGINKTIKGIKPHYVIRTWIDKRSFSKGHTYNDLYFGRLPQYLEQKGKRVIILAGMLTGYKELIWKIKSAGQFLFIPQEYFVGYSDYLKVIALTFINRIKIAKPVIFCGLEVTDFLKESLKKDYENGEINKNTLYYYYMKRFLKKINVDTFLYPFENQAWERMSISALRQYSPSTKIIGYAHSSFRPYLFGYFYSREEKDIIALPDRVVTVGKEFKTILEAAGNYKDKVELSEGCALRYEYIFKKNRIAWNKDGGILVALSMDIGYSLGLLRFLCYSLGERDGCRVILKSHPFAPVEMIMRLYNVRLNSNFQISKNQRLEDDLMDSSVLIYTNTTASMEALFCGVPVVHVDLKEPASLDPLFNLSSLKWTVSDKDQLYRALDEIYSMDDLEYGRKYNDAKAYLMRYFYPVEERYLERFV